MDKLQSRCQCNSTTINVFSGLSYSVRKKHYVNKPKYPVKLSVHYIQGIPKQFVIVRYKRHVGGRYILKNLLRIWNEFFTAFNILKHQQ